MKLEVGQKLWFSAPRYSTSKHVEITKIGREYVYVGNSGDRFKVSDDRMRICGPHQNNYGQCYLSKDEFDTEVATEKLWSNFRNSLSHLRPRGCTIDNIREAAHMLGIELKED